MEHLDGGDDVGISAGEVPPAVTGERFDLFHVAAGEQFLSRGSRGAGRDELPGFPERRVAGHERIGHHRSLGLDRIFPDASLELAGDRGRLAEWSQRPDRVGRHKRLSSGGEPAGLGEHQDGGNRWRSAEGHRRQPANEVGRRGQAMACQGAGRGNLGRHLGLKLRLHVCSHRRLAAEQDHALRGKGVKRHRHPAGDPLLPHRSQSPWGNLPGAMGFRHPRHKHRQRQIFARHVRPFVSPGHNLRALHTPPGQHEPGSCGLHHKGLHLGATRSGPRGKPAGRSPWFEQFEPEVGLANGRSPQPGFRIVAVEPPSRREQDSPHAARHRRKRGQRQALRIDGQAATADARKRSGLAGGGRVDLGRKRGEKWRARACQPRPLPEPFEPIDQFEARAEHGSPGNEHVNVP